MLNMASILISLIFIISFSPAIAGISNVESDINDLQTYIVYVQEPKHGNFSKEIDLESWYHSFLPATISSNSIDDDHQSRMVHYYRHVISGFAARLTAEEVKVMETKSGFISAHVENTLQLHTTHTPRFLGLHQNSGFWKDSNFGKGVIIGVVDSGIGPTHPSFGDKDMPPPPAKWRGKCEFAGGAGCNNKIIGARNFLNKSEPPTDNEGHGTHTSSTAAGTFVNGANILGQANGTAVGMAPLAHLAMYKACDDYNGTCPESSVSAALDAAIEDGVDVLSLSIGLGPYQHKEFHANAIAIAAFKAVKKGIFVSISAGNWGPKPFSVVNDAPWMLTVGASTTDRSIVTSVQLGNQETYDGESLLQWTDIPSEQLPLVYPVTKNASATTNCSPETLKSIDVKGKVVLCLLSVNPQDVLDAGGAAMILMNNELIGDSIVVARSVLRNVRVSYMVGESIKAYINSTSSPTAALVVKGTVIGEKSAPAIVAFSSRGPSTVSPGILKPDVVGPGVNIIAAWRTAVEPITNTEYIFDIISGTSMSCPHLSGIAALLKSAHPDWSPAAIKSAIMTTADTVNLEGKPILDRNHLPADPFAVGAGHVNPSKANDPGLIYDIQPDDYIPYLCGLNYTDQQVQGIVGGDVQCSKMSSIAEAELNYPSFSIRLGSSPQTYNRTVTNVGPANLSYTSQIVAPEGVEITIQPDKISFTEKNQKVAYSVTFTRTKNTNTSFTQANLSWISGRYAVKSPIAISFI
ncbi:subtilisin-like protease SBT1.7 [Citrus clementina]|nr:subtilisin-like protease SBT1.7 [Citrus x clementina]